MKRRIIRSFFIGLLLLCVGGWVASYRYDLSINHWDRSIVAAGCNWGKFHLRWIGGNIANYYAFHKGWNFHAVSADAERDLEYAAQCDCDYHLGFFISNGLRIKAIAIPLWFPTLISAALLWMVWRKTRLPVKGRAFPVEMREKHP